MAHYTQLVPDVSFLADVDLTTHQYKFVTVASTVGNVKLATGASNPAPVGILQNSPSLGQEARVRVFGESVVAASGNLGGCQLAYGRYGMVASNGLFQSLSTESGCTVAGRWLDAATTGATGSVFGRVYLYPAGFTASNAAAS